MVSKVKTTVYHVLKVVSVRQQENKILNYEVPPVGVKKAGMPAPPAL